MGLVAALHVYMETSPSNNPSRYFKPKFVNARLLRGVPDIQNKCSHFINLYVRTTPAKVMCNQGVWDKRSLVRSGILNSYVTPYKKLLLFYHTVRDDKESIMFP